MIFPLCIGVFTMSENQVLTVCGFYLFLFR